MKQRRCRPLSASTTASSSCFASSPSSLHLLLVPLILSGVLLLVLPRTVYSDMPPYPNLIHDDDDDTGFEYRLIGSCDEPRTVDRKGYVTLRRPADGKCVYAVSCVDDDGDVDFCESPYECGKVDPDRIPELAKDIHKSRAALLKRSNHGRMGEMPLNPILAERAKAKRARRSSAGNDDGAGAGGGRMPKPHDVLVDEEDDSEGHNRNLARITNGTMRNLVVMIRFKDHRTRNLPTRNEIDDLFNHDGPHSETLASTGSVRDVFKFNSYGDLDLKSHVTEWIDVPETERYYADGYYGMSGMFSYALTHALKVLDDDPSISLDDFDENDDKKLDAIAVLHSGYGAEWGGLDCQTNATHDNRIWSHKWLLSSSSSGFFPSKTGVHVNAYHVSPSLWGRCGREVGRIGVIAHETGHFFGLPDLYDGGGGAGIGSFGLMGNSWGFDASQNYPPMMCPWSKITLGWLDPTVIKDAGTYHLTASHSAEMVYKISDGYPSGEYLLIENRQRHPPHHTLRFEDKLPIQGGLIIWHIDEEANDTVEGFPGQYNWPENGRHYRVALLSPDGEYKLERGTSRGGPEMFFHGDAAIEIGPYGCVHKSIPNKYIKHPNTDAYGDGVYRTGHRIHNIGQAGQVMTFEFGEETLAPPTRRPTAPPTGIPTRLPTPTSNSLRTTYDGGNGKNGNMFDVEAKVDLRVHTFDMNIDSTDAVKVFVYVKDGSHVGHETNPLDWKKLGEVVATGRGKGVPTVVTGFDPHTVPATTKASFYVFTETSDVEYSNGNPTKWNTVIFSTPHMDFYQGTGKGRHFSTSTYKNRIYNGEIVYEILNANQSPPPTPPVTPSPTHEETNPPSSEPTIVPPNVYLPRSVNTTFAVGSDGSSTNVFDVFSFKTIVIDSFDMHVDTTDDITVTMHSALGSYESRGRSSAAWGDPMCVSTVKGAGYGKLTTIPEEDCSPVEMSPSTGRAFRVSIVTTGTTAAQQVDVNAEGEATTGTGGTGPFMIGKGNRFPYSRALGQRVFDCVLRYRVVSDASIESSSSSSIFGEGAGMDYATEIAISFDPRTNDGGGSSSCTGDACPEGEGVTMKPLRDDHGDEAEEDVVAASMAAAADGTTNGMNDEEEIALCLEEGGECRHGSECCRNLLCELPPGDRWKRYEEGGAATTTPKGFCLDKVVALYRTREDP